MAKKHERTESQDDSLRHPSTKRAKEIDADTPLSQLYGMLDEQQTDQPPRNVLHWFRSKDLRVEDNRGLHAASQKAQEGKGHLIAMYLFTPADMEWHGTSPARVDFVLQTLAGIKAQLAERNIPLAIVTAEERGDKVDKVLEFIKDNGVSHVFANYEYEVDELRRDLALAKRLAKEEGMTLQLCHDQTVIEPGTLTTGAGGPHKVFTPYHKAWLAEVASDPSLLDTVAPPSKNDASAKEDLKALFNQKIPSQPATKIFESTADRDRLRKLWPAGHDAGIQRLSKFLSSHVKTYHQTRSNPAKDSSSRLSAYFSSGAISVREALSAARKANSNKNFDASAGEAGVAAWVREVVFREFYRHILAVVPHESMNLPQNLKFDFVRWEDDEEGWDKWREGRTGVPFVDAGMRQLNAEAWMHNRLRMNTASYLRTNLLIDYRRGERHFAEKLIDWDLANNTQGWEPSYTVFNAVRIDRLSYEGILLTIIRSRRRKRMTPTASTFGGGCRSSRTSRARPFLARTTG